MLPVPADETSVIIINRNMETRVYARETTHLQKHAFLADFNKIILIRKLTRRETHLERKS